MTAGAFEEFVAAESTPSLRVAYLLTGDGRAAGDLLQEALIAAHHRWDRLADREEATSALRRELVAAHLGRRWSRVGAALGDSPLLAGTTGIPGFSSAHSDPVPSDETAAALAHLLPRQRVALALRYGAGLSEEAVADALGTPVADVRALVGDGLGRLGELLEVDGAAAAALVCDLAGRAPADPGDVHGRVLDGERSERRHRAGLLALAAFFVLVVLLVLFAGR
ncbi:sigma factor-like helix-turn-helix DNA-binding protein [Modestobacter sp. VKM Ac-2977]|uniref:sigma factor-like helix-turn-helix DNA-binding protein n=1 Tax=Modestobacter sp. VKM Ac-2977 TaxID=3004131 RepID=UPI0022AB1944|nr:sigma factor-like helix-turn-helix DNA-binding protein [Modestobacter sp. VKM Ac-2977]MCZ2821651.1 sigma factor-like helix-turn-helix DNA-binding protein [Modestobacter sp. VKM Ac-2977]